MSFGRSRHFQKENSTIIKYNVRATNLFAL